MRLSSVKPDILLIMPDQMRGDCLSLAGHPVVRTPVLDEIGAQGAHFTSAYTTCPSCIPARRSLLTGQFPESSGVVGYADRPIKSPVLPQLLCEAGYATRLAGRHMHQVPYDEPYGYEEQTLGSTYVDEDDYSRFLSEQLPHINGVQGAVSSFNGWQARPWLLGEDLHPTNWITAQARRQITEAPDHQPLFLTASYYAPHPPLNPPPWYFDYYLHQDLPDKARGRWVNWDRLPSIGAPVDASRVDLPDQALKLAQAGYWGLIHHLDDHLYWLVHDFIGRAEKNNHPWIILVTSDHGEMLGDHGYFRKCEPYEGSAHIPFLIRGSESLGFKNGLICDRPVCLEDIMPTLLALAGQACPDNVDGINLTPVLQGETTLDRTFIHSEHAPCYSDDQAFHMLTDGQWKYIWRPSSGKEQLFNLLNDPKEIDDLADANKADTDMHHQKKLTQWRGRLARVLKNRPEGFSDGSDLRPGQTYLPLQ